MTNKLKRLEEIASSNIERRVKYLNQENYLFEKEAYLFSLENWKNAWNEYLNFKNIEKAKSIFSESGFIDLMRMEMFNHRVLDMQNTSNNLACVLLSDNTDLIQKFADINYLISYISRDKPVNITFRDYANKGELVAIFSLSVLCLFKKDMAEFQKSLLVFEKLISTKKSASILLPDFEFLKSLLSNNKDIIKSKIEIFLTKKLHNQRMKDELLLDDSISLPAILFLKLTWSLGIEIEIASPLIPMELMPIQPLETYNSSYLELIKY